MANWWDQIQNGLGQAYMPNYGSLDPQAQQAANQQAMMQLGAGLLANSTKRPGEALGRSLGGLQQSGMQAMQAQAMAETMNDRRDEKRRRNQLSQALAERFRGTPYEQLAPFMNANDAMQALSGREPTAAMQNFEYFQSLPPEGQQQWLQQNGKDGSRNLVFKDINGRVVGLDPITGERKIDAGQSGTKEQTVPASVQADVAKTNAAYDTLSQELNDYIQMVEKGGASWVPGSQERDAIGQKMRNIQLQAKELYNLGVLNGPDLTLMEEMLFDPRVGITNPTAAWDAAGRAKRSAEAFRAILKRVRDSKQKMMGGMGGQPSQGGGEAVDWQEYFGGQ